MKIKKSDLVGYSGQELAKIILELMSSSLEGGDLSRQLLRYKAGQRALYTIRRFDSEVNNGGFHQYFFNSSGDLANITSSSLALVGAKEADSILREALKRFPTGRPDDDRATRIEQLKSLNKDSFADLDKRYYSLAKLSPNTNPWQLALQHLGAQPDQYMD